MRPRYIDYSLHARLNENILSAHIYNFYFVRAMIANLFVCAYLRKILHICPTRLFIASRICLYINAPALYPFFIAPRICQYINTPAPYPFFNCFAHMFEILPRPRSTRLFISSHIWYYIDTPAPYPYFTCFAHMFEILPRPRSTRLFTASHIWQYINAPACNDNKSIRAFLPLYV